MNRIEMHAITKYSMNNESTIDIKKLILKCVENDEKGVAIIDNDYVSSFIKAEKILKELNIKDFKLIYGIELNVLYKLKNYKMVLLIKNKHAIRDLYQQLSSYTTLKYIKLDSLLKIKNNLLFGLIYEENNYNEDLLKYVDYIEVNKDINKKVTIKISASR